MILNLGNSHNTSQVDQAKMTILNGLNIFVALKSVSC